MRFSHVIAASVVAPLVAAHGNIPGAPKIFGLPRDLKAPAPIAARVARHVSEPKRGLLETRQGGQNGRCGPDFGGASCDQGFCCSGAVRYRQLPKELQIADPRLRDIVARQKSIARLRIV